MDAAPDDAAAGRRLVLGRDDPVQLFGRRVVAGVGHAERRGDPLANDLVQWLPRGQLDQLAEGDHVEVAVDVRRAGRTERGHVVHRGDALLRRRPLAVERDPGRQPGGVGEQLPEGDGALATSGEGRQVRRHRGVEVEAAAFHLLEHRDRGEQLGHRREVEDAVATHRHLLVGRELGACAVGVPEGVADRFVGGDHAVVARRARRRRRTSACRSPAGPGTNGGRPPSGAPDRAPAPPAPVSPIAARAAGQRSCRSPPTWPMLTGRRS